MGRKGDGRKIEERYYVNEEERDVITRASEITKKSKSEYVREIAVEQAIRDLLDAGLPIPQRYPRREIVKRPAAPVDWIDQMRNGLTLALEGLEQGAKIMSGRKDPA